MLTLIKHLRTPGPFQSLLKISLHWYQVIAGVSFSPFRYTSFSLPYLDHPWFDCARSFLRHCSAHLDIPDTPLPSPKRYNDKCIMDGFLAQDLPSTVLQRINCCRLFLKVTQLSDISTLAGDQIERNAWLGTKPMPSNDDAWPTQPRPDEASWRLWRKAISNSVCTNDKKNVLATRPGTLTEPLGFWLHDSAPRSSPRWKSYFSHSSQRLFQPDPQRPLHYKQLSTNTRLAFSLALYNPHDV